jgi:hypothetical protein
LGAPHPPHGRTREVRSWPAGVPLRNGVLRPPPRARAHKTCTQNVANQAPARRADRGVQRSYAGRMMRPGSTAAARPTALATGTERETGASRGGAGEHIFRCSHGDRRGREPVGAVVRGRAARPRPGAPRRPVRPARRRVGGRRRPLRRARRHSRGRRPWSASSPPCRCCWSGSVSSSPRRSSCSSAVTWSEVGRRGGARRGRQLVRW